MSVSLHRTSTQSFLCWRTRLEASRATPRGSVLGTLTGALIMSVITSGCTALGLTNPIQDLILGIIIVAAVTLDQLRQRKQAA